MPIHDWTGVDDGLFHDFHQVWTVEIRNTLNRGVLPPGYFALAEQVVGGPVPDVITLQRRPAQAEAPDPGGALAVADASPRAWHVSTAETDLYTRKANRVVIKHRHGRVVAVIEIVSPGNKKSAHAVRSFVDKTYEEGSEHILAHRHRKWTGPLSDRRHIRSRAARSRADTRMRTRRVRTSSRDRDRHGSRRCRVRARRTYRTMIRRASSRGSPRRTARGCVGGSPS